MLNPIDTALQTVTPTIMVPRHQTFVPMVSNGHRFLAASDGLWLEARRPWLYVRWPLCKQLTVPMPYGAVEQSIEVRQVPRDFIHQFIEIARKHCPLECAAWIVWNSVTDQWKLVELDPIEVTSASVRFVRPSLDDDEHLVMDVHSHGRHRAFFSSQDNEDDRGEFKVAGVFGNLDGEVQAKFRLCGNGLFVDLGKKWEE